MKKLLKEYFRRQVIIMKYFGFGKALLISAVITPALFVFISFSIFRRAIIYNPGFIFIALIFAWLFIYTFRYNILYKFVMKKEKDGKNIKR